MITKIVLNGVASFKKPAELITDKKVNLIYGLNGTGKSTISNFLYKRTDSKYKNCSVACDENTELIVYSQAFVQEQFFETDSLNGIFTLSKANKDAETKIAAAEKEIKKIDAAILEKQEELSKVQEEINKKQQAAHTTTWAIKTNYSGGDRVLEFCLEGRKGDKSKLFSYIDSLKKPQTKPTKTIENIKEDVVSLSGEHAQKYSIYPLFEFAAADVEKNSLLKKQIVGSSNSSVGEFINRLSNSDWVKEGLQYIPPSISEAVACPFCQQETISKELAKEISNYFDESYENDLSSLKHLRNRYSEAINSLPAQTLFESNGKFEPLKKDFELAYGKCINTFSNNLKLIDEKIASPSISIDLVNSENDLEALSGVITKLNSETKMHNDRIDNREGALDELKSQFWNLMRWDYDQTISRFAQDSLQAAQNVSSINSSIIQLQGDRLKQEKTVAEQQKLTVNIDDAISNINVALTELGIDEFKIIKDSEILYKISRPDSMVNVFHTLSEGEKMIISFLYFMELCKGKKNATDAGKKKIAIIDDPISSLSHIYIFNIGRLIHQEFLRSDKYEQVFVLTHSLYFFYELTDINNDRRKETQKLFRLWKNAHGSEILEMKYEEIQNDYHAYWQIVKDEKQPPALIANCMRNIIEYFFAFIEKKDLNNVFQMQELQKNKFDAFNRYINRESHSKGQNIFDIKEFNYEDFREAFRLVFDKSGYNDHYKKMIN